MRFFHTVFAWAACGMLAALLLLCLAGRLKAHPPSPRAMRGVPPAALAAFLALAAAVGSRAVPKSRAPARGGTRSVASAGAVPLRALPGDAAEHECSITDFTLDHSDRTARFVISWTDGLFDHTLTRNLYLYATTNLAERRWSMLGAFPVPLSATSPHALTVTQANVFEAMRPRFLDTFGGAGFYRFEIDLESGNVAEGLAALLHVFADPVIVAPTTLGVNDDDDDGNGREDWEDASLLDCDDDIAEVHVRFTGPPWMDCTARLETWMDPLMFGHLWKNRAKTGYAMSAPSREEFTFRGELVKTYLMEADFRSPNMRGNKMVATTQFGEVSLSATHVPIFVERVAEPVTTERINGHIVNPCCAVIGADAHMRVKVLPEDYPDSRIKWRVVEGAGSFPEGDTGRDVVFRASGAEGETVKLQVDVGDCPGNAPQFTMQTTAMHEVKIYPCVISRLGREPPATAEKINAMLEEVNVIFRQVGMHFSLGAPIVNLVNDSWSRNGLVDKSVGREIRNIMCGTDGLEVYFIEGLEREELTDTDQPLGTCNMNGIIVSRRADGVVLAHEIGHACGWADIFSSGSDQLSPLLRREMLPCDWNNGTGGRFYEYLFNQWNLVDRLLMHGTRTGAQCDIPLGMVEGLTSRKEYGFVNVGCSQGFMTRSPRSR